MARILFGSLGKILFWLFFAMVVMIGFAAPAFLLFAFILLLAGPGVAIPAIIAQRGKHVVTTRSAPEIKSVTDTVFAQRKAGRNWAKLPGGLGELNYQLTSARSGFEPAVSAEIADAGDGTRMVHVWMSEWTQGGLNGGKGTPFWVWGGTRAMTKVSEAAKALTSPAGAASGVDPRPIAPSITAHPARSPRVAPASPARAAAPPPPPAGAQGIAGQASTGQPSRRRRAPSASPSYTPPS